MQNQQQGWVKVVVLILLAIGIGFVLLNFDYFTKQGYFYVEKTFVSNQQKQFLDSEKPLVMEANHLQIPSLNISAPIMFVEKASEAEFQPALARGVVLYPGTASVGELGNTYIFGHSSDFVFSKGDYKTVFALLPKIDIGAEVLATDALGRIYKYKVFNKFVAQKTDVGLLSQETNGKHILTLQTSYPIGTALKRYIVQAELEDN